jgi:hypothetical protein
LAGETPFSRRRLQLHRVFSINEQEHPPAILFRRFRHFQILPEMISK